MTAWTIFGVQCFALSLSLYGVTAWGIKPFVRLVGDTRRRGIPWRPASWLFPGHGKSMTGPRLKRYEFVLKVGLLALGVGVALRAPWSSPEPIAEFWDVAIGIGAMLLSTQIHRTAKTVIPAAIAARLGLSTPLREPEAPEGPHDSSLGDIDTLGS